MILRWLHNRTGNAPTDPPRHAPERRCGHWWLVCALWLAIASSASAERWPGLLESDRFDRLGVAEGLSQKRVLDIHQDRDGFMWFATQNGLSRYDGHRFVVYRHDPEDPESIADNYVVSIAENSNGQLLLGTTSGIDHFDPVTGRATRVTAISGLPSFLDVGIRERADGTFWILSGESPQIYDPENDRLLGEGLPGVPAGVAALDILEDLDGTIWLATAEGVLRVSANDQSVEPVELPEIPGTTANKVIHELLRDHAGALWVRSANQLLRQRPDGGFEPFILDPERSSLLLVSMKEDRNGNLWVGSAVHGAYVVDSQREKIKRFRHIPGIAGSLSNNTVFSFFMDRTGVVWIGTDDGLSRLDPSRQKIALYQHDPTRASLGPASVLAIAQDREGALWVGHMGGGLDRIDPSRQEIEHFRHRSDDPSSLPDDSVWALLEDRRGVLWIGGNAGLCRYDPRQRGFHVVPHVPDAPRSDLERWILTLLEDRRGRILVGSRDGLSRLDPRSGRTERLPGGVESASVLALHEDPNGDLWIGTDNDGLYHLATDGTMATYRHDRTDRSSLGHDVISSIHRDVRGRLWIGTLGGGLQRYLPKHRAFARYGIAEGLPDQAIKGIIEDREGLLWLSTDRGLARFSPDGGEVQVLDMADGLLETGFGNKVYFHGQDGELFFGGRDLVAFHPEDLQADPIPPRVVITEAQTSERQVARPDLADSEDVQLVLGHRESDVTFSFAVLHFAAPARNRLSYWLEGFDLGWITAEPGGRSVRYTNLDPGTYVLHARGSNKDGAWSEREAHLTIRVQPPPWRSPLAFAVYILAVVGTVAGFVRAQRGKVAREKTVSEHLRNVSEERRRLIEELRDRNDELERFNSSLSHNLRNPLITIHNYLGLARRSLTRGGTGSVVERDLGRVAQAAGEMHHLVDDMLELYRHSHGGTGKAESVELDWIFRRAMEELESPLSKRGVEVEIQGLLPVVRGEPKRLMLVARHLIDNAIKFLGTQPAPRIEIGALGAKDSRTQIYVRDNGVGIASRYQEKVFQMFEQLDPGSPGTGIGLTLVKRIVERYGGRIWVESEGEGSGSIVWLELLLASSG